MTTQNGNDDFLVQIKETEKKHDQIVEKAKSDFIKKIQNEKHSLKKLREININKVKEVEKNNFITKQKSMRSLYDELRKEGTQASQKIVQETTPIIEKIIPAAQNFFLQAL